MNLTMPVACYVNIGELRNGHTDEIIHNPAVLVDAESDIIYKYGEAQHIQSLCEKYNQAGFTVALFALDDLSVGMQCYVIRRMLEYTASGFVQKFVAMSSTPDALQWLQSEIERIPIDIYARELVRK